MFTPGQKVRLIKPVVGVRCVIPVVGTIGEVVECPRPWNEESLNYVWVRFSLKQRHGDDTIKETPYGLKDMTGSVWLLDEDDFDDEQRAYACTGFDPDCLKLVEDEDEPNPFEGFQAALVAAWQEENRRAFETFMSESTRLHEARMAVLDERPENMMEVYRERDAACKAHRDAGKEQYVSWDRCLAKAGLGENR